MVLKLLPAAFMLSLAATLPAAEPLLDRQALLEGQTFWDNKDWDWYQAHIPFFECPDPDINTTYYYRFELLTKHLTYGSPNSGYSFTEFIDRPFWSGAYGAISCPAGHQLYEARWLRDPRIARDYSRYWFRTPGAQPRRYSTWLADALWAVHQVHPDDAFLIDLLPDLIRNYEGWERERFVPEVGLYWQTGHDDGMEININSRQTPDTVRGAPGYRPTLNAYLWADALAIARAARLAGDQAAAKRYSDKAAALRKNLHDKLWDPKRNFFFHMYQRDEQRDGAVIKAGTLTYQSGRYAGSEHGRELIGYVPWQFGMVQQGYEAAWQYLMDRRYFFAKFGPTTVERRDPQFLISKTCCVWSGQSWPYATTQTLKAMANLLQDYPQTIVTKQDYYKLLQVYTLTHRKHGRPYLAEAAHPDTGSWEGHDAHNHSEHYFHSGYVDLIITGLVGLRPRDDDTLELQPLAPDEWDYFALDRVAYKGRELAIAWDKRGDRYGLGAGLHVLADGKVIAGAPRLQPLRVPLPPRKGSSPLPAPLINYAVNNDGYHFPHVSASYENEQAPLYQVVDGNYWYHLSPPNRWTCTGSPNAADWLQLDFGLPRKLREVKLYLLDDGQKIAPPAKIELQHWNGRDWAAVAGSTQHPPQPVGRRANVFRFPEIETPKLRVVLTHAAAARSGLSELEAWGPGTPPIDPAPPPEGNLAANPGGKDFPKATASHTSRFDKVEMVNDGRIVFRPSPHNRWTAYESPNDSDWLEIDFGREQTVGRLVLHIYDDGGGVQAPASYGVQYRDGAAWRDALKQQASPAKPRGGAANTVIFTPVKTAKVRVVFTHAGKSRSGLTEIEAWEK